jgi:prophage antirepressor-like protein
MQIITKEFHGLKVRIVLINGIEWFVAKDISEILSYSQTQAMLKLIDDEDILRSSKMDERFKNVGNIEIDELFKNQGSIILINESGLYSAIIGSKKFEAKTFKKWITREVLPSIRKTGTYSISQQKSEILKPNQNINFVEQLQNLKEYKDFSFEVLDFIDNLQSRNKLVLYRFDKFMRAQFNEQPLKRFQIDLENEYFIPTKLGEFINVSAIEMNRILEKNGFQIRENNSWKLTEKARDFAIEIPNKSYMQLKWNLKTISEFK